MAEVAKVRIGIIVIGDSALVVVASEAIVLLPPGVPIIQKGSVGVILSSIRRIGDIDNRLVDFTDSLCLAIGWEVLTAGGGLIRGKRIDGSAVTVFAVCATSEENCHQNYGQ